MSGAESIPESDLHAFIDGELEPGRMAEIARVVAADPALARRVADFRADRQRLAAIYAPLADRPVPQDWIARIEAASAPRPAPRRTAMWAVALAASLLLMLGGAWRIGLFSPNDSILAQAAAARDGSLAKLLVFADAALPDAKTRDAWLQSAIGLRVRAPDLTRFGYRLVELDKYGNHAAGLRYRNAARLDLTIYVRPSVGAPRFDLLRQGRLRVCIWQDDVVGTVLTGDMSAGAMMRIASAAYSELNL